MMRGFYFFFFIGTFHTNFAQSALQSPQRFIPASFMGESISSLSSAVNLLDSSSGRCTAGAISNDGHFLTARHCLQHCLIRSGVFKYQRSPEGLTYFVLDQKMLGSAQCEVSLNHQVKVITIEATSPGLITNMDERSFEMLEPELFESLVAQGFTSEGDFVIFKSERPSSVCLKFGQSLGHLKTLHTLSYPSTTFRSDGNNSNGKDLYYSRGVRRNSILENKCLKDFNLKENQRNSLVKRFDSEASFVSTLDAIYGSSGSAVFDDDQNIIGILTNTYRHSHLTNSESDEPENLYCEGSAKALRTSAILSTLETIGFDVTNLTCDSQ